jgi:hypothetical protein
MSASRAVIGYVHATIDSFNENGGFGENAP